MFRKVKKITKSYLNQDKQVTDECCKRNRVVRELAE